MIPPSIPNVPMYRGDTLNFPTMTFTSGAEPMDFSGSVLNAQWRTAIDSDTGFNLSVAVDGNEVRLVMSAADTALVSGSGVWDLQCNTDGVVKTLVRGTTTLTKDVSALVETD